MKIQNHSNRRIFFNFQNEFKKYLIVPVFLVESFATFAKKSLMIYLVASNITGLMFESSLFGCIDNHNHWADLNCTG
jgi:hypothetical protein